MGIWLIISPKVKEIYCSNSIQSHNCQKIVIFQSGLTIAYWLNGPGLIPGSAAEFFSSKELFHGMYGPGRNWLGSIWRHLKCGAGGEWRRK